MYLIILYTVFRYGSGGEGFSRIVGKSALQSGSMFGLFMGIGGLIRCESPKHHTSSYSTKALALYQPNYL
jgi:Reactive mitochondrial oxygen species modulator 1